MELVIDIHEKDYQEIKNGHIPFSVLDAIINGTLISDWLNSFDTSSATKCFEAVNILKERLEHEETD